ncbi:MAG: potassium transporter TrkG [Dermabacter sp.]|nr:potassium transporter TrkG [Dermabacter sp.]
MQRFSRAFDRPAVVITVTTLAVLAAGTALLLAPFSWRGRAPSVIDALFTTASALCVTGLTTVDTEHQWTAAGHAVILVLMQIGGLGVMVIISMVALVTAHRLGVRQRLAASTLTPSTAHHAPRLSAVMRGVFLTTIIVEGVVTAMLTWRFADHYDLSLGRAAWFGLFHTVSAFNNAGFGLLSDNLIPFGRDPWILLPMAGAIILGGIGFPVIIEVVRHLRTGRSRGAHLSVHSRIMLAGTPVLLLLGTLLTLASEFTNAKTLGPMPWADKIVAALFHSTTSRTAGFNAIDLSVAHSETWFITDILMLIGAGPAGTAGGLKVTTFVILLAVIVSEVRGERDVRLFHRRIPDPVIRQVVALVGLFALLIIAATLTISALESAGVERVLFETISALTTTGLSTGITMDLSWPSKLVLIVLMLLGRVGPVTLGAAFALRERPLLFTPPAERPIIG